MPRRPVMPKSDAKIAALFETLLPADERVVMRPMFGHRAAFVNGIAWNLANVSIAGWLLWRLVHGRRRGALA